MPDLNGALLIDKPAGLTSHDVVARVRRLIGMRRVGHAGTLDPFATGLLVICIGRTTRLVQYLAGLDKEYVATIRLGFATDTQDYTGNPVSERISADQIDSQAFRTVLAGFSGPVNQVPPMFSAKKVGGERLYKAAREGREIERSPIPITVYALELLEDRGCEDGLREFTVRVSCSSGTYVRTLAHDIGERLGTGAHLTALRRTGVGSFGIGQAYKLEELEERVRRGNVADVLLSPSETVGHLPALVLDEARRARTVRGQEVRLSPEENEMLAGKRQIRMCASDGMLIAIGEGDESTGVVRPRVVLAEPLSPTEEAS